MKSPAFSFYVRDWLCSNTVSKLHSKSYSKDGSNLCSRGVGAYVFLLCQSWLQVPCGTLPDNDVELADLARVSMEEWQALKPLIMPCFQKDLEGRLYNDRLMIEVRKQQSRSKAGSIGGSTKQANKVAALEIEIENAFNTFWSIYPRKTAKQDARRAWDKIPDVLTKVQKIVAAVEQQKNSDQWKKDGGQFIPYPATWLNRGSWEDEGILLNNHKIVRDPNIFIFHRTPYTRDNPPQRNQFPNDSAFQTCMASYESFFRKARA